MKNKIVCVKLPKFINAIIKMFCKKDKDEEVASKNPVEEQPEQD